jgi:hypothetical protein
MDQLYLDELCESVYSLFDIENLSFDAIVLCYSTTLEYSFTDNIYNRGRYFIFDYLAVYIAKRVTRVDKKLLLRALRERLKEKFNGGVRY